MDGWTGGRAAWPVVWMGGTSQPTTARRCQQRAAHAHTVSRFLRAHLDRLLPVYEYHNIESLICIILHCSANSSADPVKAAAVPTGGTTSLSTDSDFSRRGTQSSRPFDPGERNASEFERLMSTVRVVAGR